MSDLLKFIQAYLAQANIRGIDRENPIPFIVRSPEGQPNEGKQFVVQVGYSEPTFNQLPYSVLWICFDKESDMHAKLYRRVSHHPSALTPNLYYTWMEITEYDQVFEKEQFYVPVADLDLVDGTDQVDPIMVASTDAFGTVVTTESVVEPRAILGTDQRLADSRQPTDHDHEDEPRTMLKLFGYEEPLTDENGDAVIIDGQPIMEVKVAYVRIEDAFPSEENELLFIKEKDPLLENVWIGEWRRARPEDIESTGPKVVSARIIAPTANFEDNQDYDFNWEVTYDDENVVVVNPSEWTVTDNVLSIVIDEDGILSIPDLQEDTQVTVAAKATYDGQEFTDSVEVNISDTFTPVTPERIEISGPTTVKELLPAKYEVKLYMSNGTSSVVTPDSFVSDNTDAAIIDINGNMTTYDITENQPVTLTAEYSVDGQTFQDTFDMTVLVEILDWNIEIRGAASMDESTSETYEVYTIDELGTETLIATPNTFELSEGDAHATLVGMQLNANDVKGNQRVTLFAEHTVDGVTKSANKSVNIIDLTAYPASIEVTFPAEVDEGSTTQLVLNIVDDEGGKTSLGRPDTVKFNKQNVLSYTAPLAINALTVTADTTVTITVEHTIDGQKITGTATTKVKNTISAPTRLKPNQPITYVNENGVAVGFYLSLVNDDNSETQITDFENVTLTPDGTHPLTVVQEGQGWLLSTDTAVVGGNHVMKMLCEYEHNGNTLTLDHDIQIVDSVKAVVGIEVAGGTAVNEGGVIDLQVKLLKDDSTKETLANVAPVAVTQSPNNIFTIAKSGNKIKCTAPTNLTRDTVVTVTVEHDVDGQTFTDDHEITISNTQKQVSSWEINGPDTVIVGRQHVEQYAYDLTFDYDDGTQTTGGKAAEWRITDNPNVNISNQDNGRIGFTIQEKDVTTDQTFTIEARAIINGTSTWKGKVVTITPQDRSEIGFRLHGDSELNENVVSTEYVGQAHFESRWVNNCELKNLVIVGEAHGATIVNGNQVDTSKVTAEQTITLRGTFDWSDVTNKTADFQVTLKNNLIDFKSATFKQSGGEKPEGTEINPMLVEITMSNNTKRNGTAKSVSITKGANLVDVSGSGANTRWTVKSGLAADGLVEWTGVVTVDGIDENVTKGSFTAKKLEAFVMKPSFAMCEALQPEQLLGDASNILPLMEADHYFFEITDAMAAKAKVGASGYQEIDLGLTDAPNGTYPVYPEPAPYSTGHIITKAKWGRPEFVNTIGQAEGNWSGARTYEPRDLLNTLPDTKPAPWKVDIDAKYDTHQTAESNAVRYPISYIPYTDPNDGEQYILTRCQMPMAPTVGQPTFLRVRFVDWLSAFPS